MLPPCVALLTLPDTDQSLRKGSDRLTVQRAKRAMPCWLKCQTLSGEPCCQILQSWRRGLQPLGAGQIRDGVYFKHVGAGDDPCVGTKSFK